MKDEYGEGFLAGVVALGRAIALVTTGVTPALAYEVTMADYVENAEVAIEMLTVLQRGIRR